MTQFQAYQPFIGNIAAVILDSYTHREENLNLLKYRKECKIQLILNYII